ncbi:MAG: hypothetical protein Fur0021_30550 [Candidatus Promineifilaceae bacterium]
MEQPERVLSQTIAGIRHTEETQQKARLLAALVRLLPDEEMTKIVEFLEQDEVLLLDTLYLRKMQRTGWEQGMQESWTEGLAEGPAEGK